MHRHTCLDILKHACTYMDIHGHIWLYMHTHRPGKKDIHTHRHTLNMRDIRMYVYIMYAYMIAYVSAGTLAQLNTHTSFTYIYIQKLTGTYII